MEDLHNSLRMVSNLKFHGRLTEKSLLAHVRETGEALQLKRKFQGS